MLTNADMQPFLLQNEIEAKPFPYGGEKVVEGTAGAVAALIADIKQRYPEARLDDVVLDGRPHRFLVGDEVSPSGCYIAQVKDGRLFATVYRIRRFDCCSD